MSQFNPGPFMAPPPPPISQQPVWSPSFGVATGHLPVLEVIQDGIKGQREVSRGYVPHSAMGSAMTLPTALPTPTSGLTLSGFNPNGPQRQIVIDTSTDGSPTTLGEIVTGLPDKLEAQAPLMREVLPAGVQTKQAHPWAQQQQQQPPQGYVYAPTPPAAQPPPPNFTQAPPAVTPPPAGPQQPITATGVPSFWPDGGGRVPSSPTPSAVPPFPSSSTPVTVEPAPPAGWLNSSAAPQVVPANAGGQPTIPVQPPTGNVDWFVGGMILSVKFHGVYLTGPYLILSRDPRYQGDASPPTFEPNDPENPYKIRVGKGDDTHFLVCDYLAATWKDRFDYEHFLFVVRPDESRGKLYGRPVGSGNGQARVGQDG